ncbi:MAG: hypothetical protein C4293_14450 [Nitrospiraceae bacterium]
MATFFVVAAMVMILGCATTPDQSDSRNGQGIDGSGASSDEENRLPKDARPKPVRPTCPSAMTGSC